MRGKTWLLLHCAFAAILTSDTSFAETFTVNFKVIDSKGSPVAGVELSTRWAVNRPADQVPQSIFDKAISDKNGMAKLEFDDHSGVQQVLLGYSQDRKLGGLAIVERQDEGKTVEIEVLPTISVVANYVCSETESIPAWTRTRVSIEKVHPYFFVFDCQDGKVRFPLPPGEWKLEIRGTDIVKQIKTIKTKPGEHELVVGEVDFTATPMVRLRGKPAPELNIVDARGVAKDFQLADLKGKWVLMEFWSYS